jgi:hypothetical protein
VNPELTLLHVKGDGATAIGYGRFGVKLAAAIEAEGVDLYNHLDQPVKPNHLQEQVEGTRTGLTNVVGWVSTPGHAQGWHKGQYSVLFSMWEAQRLPEAYREHLYAFDLVVVPSEQNVELFSRFHPNVKLAYLGVDPAEWGYVKRTPPDRYFNFLIGGTGARKGTDLAVDAFRKVFSTWPKDDPVPRLVMKNPKGEDFYGDRIEMVTGRLSDDDERALYETAHCYLQPSRGEGFGLQPLQAICQGIPTILTDAHGQASFAKYGYGLSTTNAKSAYFIYGEAGDWWEPNLDELCEYMEYVYNNYEDAEARAAENARLALAEFTWQNSARQFLDAIGRDRLTQPYSGDGSWFAPERKLYPVRVLKDFAADIAGSKYLWRPGRTFHETADVKRILFEAGLLDPSCVEGDGEDTGLLPVEVARVDSYSAQHSFCHFCGQKAGTGVTREQELLAE